MKVDNDFGEMTFEEVYGYYEWEAERSIPAFGEEATQIIIESDPHRSIAEQQRDVFRLLLANHSGIHAKIKYTIFDYYQDIRKQSLLAFSPEMAEAHLPEIHSVAQIHQLLSYPSIYLHLPKNDKRVFGIAYECVWDDTYGLGIRIEDWQVTNIGFTDAILE